MENKDKYVEYVEGCAEIRKEINTQLYGNGIGPIKKLAEKVLGLPKPHYKLIHDMIYYKGGYPSETSPPRLEEFLDRFIALYRYFTFLGKIDEIKDYLKQAGIESSLESNMVVDAAVIVDEDVENLWGQAFPGEDIGDYQTYGDFLDKLLDRSLALQEDICHMADSIKIDTAEKVAEECKIKKPYFVKAVNAMAKQLVAADAEKKKEIGDKVQDDAENHEDAVSIL